MSILPSLCTVPLPAFLSKSRFFPAMLWVKDSRENREDELKENWSRVCLPRWEGEIQQKTGTGKIWNRYQEEIPGTGFPNKPQIPGIVPGRVGQVWSSPGWCKVWMAGSGTGFKDPSNPYQPFHNYQLLDGK